MKINKYPVRLALDAIDGPLTRELKLKRLSPPSRSKTHFFEVPMTKRQFALVVGDAGDDGVFNRKQTRIIFQECPPSIEGVHPSGANYNGGSMKLSFSRLAAPDQHSVFVSSDSALRQLITWYAKLP